MYYIYKTNIYSFILKYCFRQGASLWNACCVMLRSLVLSEGDGELLKTFKYRSNMEVLINKGSADEQ